MIIALLAFKMPLSAFLRRRKSINQRRSTGGEPDPRGLPASGKDEASIVAKSAAAGEKREALRGLLAPSEPEKLVQSN